MKRLYFYFLLITIGNLCYAYDFQYNELYYNITSVSELTVELCAPPDGVKYPDELVIPSTVEYGGKNLSVKGFARDALSDCSNLKSIYIPGTVTSIRNNSFKNCTSLSKVVFEDGIEDLKLGHGETSNVGYWGLFHNCPIISVYLGRDLVFDEDYIGYNHSDYAPFQYVNTLKEIFIGDNCKNVCRGCFRGCSGVESVYFSNSILSIGYEAFYGCKSLTSIDFPESLTSIGGAAFRGCENLKEITIPRNVAGIGSYSFGDCFGIERITFLGKTDVDELAFGHENEPSADVYVYSKEPANITASSFTHNTFLKTLYVPVGTRNLYSMSAGWKEFWNVEEFNNMEQKKCDTPTIKYVDGLLEIESATPSSKCFYSLKCSDSTPTSAVTSEIPLSAVYEINAYAIADGYARSEVAEAMLYWISGALNEQSNIISIQSRGVVVTSGDGIVRISGLEESENVSFYSLDGKMLKAISASHGIVQFMTSIPIVVVRIGNSSFKVFSK